MEIDAQWRRYRARFATLGAPEVEGNVEFVLDLGILRKAPVVHGSKVKPLAGSTELRPFTMEGVDENGSLIEAFTRDGRWAGLGRLVDVQHQLEDDDPDLDPWTTYGTGRCSALDEQDGPANFRMGVSDESWIPRRALVLNEAYTTQLWPGGVRYFWRGLQKTLLAEGTLIGQEGDAYRIRLTRTFVANQASGGTVPQELVRWIENDAKPPEVRAQEPGNFEHLRLQYPNANDQLVDWEVVGFGPGPTFSMQSFEDAVDQAYPVTIDVWIHHPGVPFAAPAASGDGAFYAPTAPPSREVPLHIGAIDDPVWGRPLETDGYLHPATVARRMWDLLGVRYDDDNVAALEADETFVYVAPIVREIPSDPHRWLEEEVLGPQLIHALRDVRGRMKLVDMRAPFEREDGLVFPTDPTPIDLETLPLLDATNGRNHRWQLRGRELMNSVTWEFLAVAQEEGNYTFNERTAVPVWMDGEGEVLWTKLDSAVEMGLDRVKIQVGTLGPINSDNIDEVGRRARTFNAKSVLEPLGLRGIARKTSVPGRLWEQMVGATTEQLLEMFQDGPQIYTGIMGHVLADQEEEGRFILIDETQLKGANPATAARTGRVLVIILSLTRHPAHAEYEAMRVRGVSFPVFEAPC